MTAAHSYTLATSLPYAVPTLATQSGALQKRVIDFLKIKKGIEACYAHH